MQQTGVYFIPAIWNQNIGHVCRVRSPTFGSEVTWNSLVCEWLGFPQILGLFAQFFCFKAVWRYGLFLDLANRVTLFCNICSVKHTMKNKMKVEEKCELYRVYKDVDNQLGKVVPHRHFVFIKQLLRHAILMGCMAFLYIHLLSQCQEFFTSKASWDFQNSRK